jgi:hypothetical protein
MRIKIYRRQIMEVGKDLGKLGRDRVTGFEGIVTAHATHLFGCDALLLTPKAKDGERKDSQWFDIGRIKIIGEGINAADVKADKPGGENSPSLDRVE